MNQHTIDAWAKSQYQYGFSSNIDQMIAPEGLNEKVIAFISAQKKEPTWLLKERLKAYHHWKTLQEPHWANIDYAPINYQGMSYYAAFRQQNTVKSLEDVDPAILNTFERLGIPLQEQKRLAGVAVDAVLDSSSIGTTLQKELAKHNIIFCSFSQAVQQHPHLVKKYLGRIVPYHDHFFAALNAAVFSDGSFCYIPAGITCPVELSTYFRINAMNTGQFERTLIIGEKKSKVSYLEGCTAPMRNTHQLHAATVEIYAGEDAEIRYATIQNWYPGNEQGQGGVLNFVTKRALCAGDRAHVSWTQLETGAARTWKYPSCILKGNHSLGEFYSVAVTKGHQQADTGTKMIHHGHNTRSRIVSKGISAGHSCNTYRGLVHIAPQAHHAYNYSQCESLLIGNQSSASTLPYIEAHHPNSIVEHEATTSKINDEQLFYCQQRGLSEEKAHALLATGFCRDVLNKLPMEFAIEGQKLLEITLEGSVG